MSGGATIGAAFLARERVGRPLAARLISTDRLPERCNRPAAAESAQRTLCSLIKTSR